MESLVHWVTISLGQSHSQSSNSHTCVFPFCIPSLNTLPLHSTISPDEQYRVFLRPEAGRRKVSTRGQLPTGRISSSVFAGSDSEGLPASSKTSLGSALCC